MVLRLNRLPTVSYFVSCGEEASDFRQQVYAAVESAKTVMRHCGTAIAVDTWNYQHQPGELLERGELRTRSLAEISDAALVIGIFCTTVPLPVITQDELRAAVGRAKDDDDISVYIFLQKPVGEVHKQFMVELEAIYDGQISRMEFEGPVEFERKIGAALMAEFMPLHASISSGETP